MDPIDSSLVRFYRLARCFLSLSVSAMLAIHCGGGFEAEAINFCFLLASCAGEEEADQVIGFDSGGT